MVVSGFVIAYYYVNRYGDCDGDARDANFIQSKHPDGTVKVYGSIRVGSDICHIRPNANNEDEVICTPESEFGNEAELVLEGDAGHGGARNLRHGVTPSSINGVIKFDKGASERRDLEFTDSHHRQLGNDVNIDVLVVWTNASECRQSGMTKGCVLNTTTELNMRGLVDLAVQETNTAFNLSGISTTLRLVHAYRDPDYVEPTGGSPITTALGNLRIKTDGKLDSVHTKRALYRADAVHMIMGTCACDRTKQKPRVPIGDTQPSHTLCCFLRLF